MASQILPVWCTARVKGTRPDGTPFDLKCGRRGQKAHGGLCPRHRAEFANKTVVKG